MKYFEKNTWVSITPGLNNPKTTEIQSLVKAFVDAGQLEFLSKPLHTVGPDDGFAVYKITENDKTSEHDLQKLRDLGAGVHTLAGP